MKLPQEMQRKITTYLPLSTDFGADKHLQEVYLSRKKSLNMFKRWRNNWIVQNKGRYYPELCNSRNNYLQSWKKVQLELQKGPEQADLIYIKSLINAFEMDLLLYNYLLRKRDSPGFDPKEFVGTCYSQRRF